MTKIKVLMASAEVSPFAKVGGLADVVGSLPNALAQLHIDVRIIMPLYGSIDRVKFGLEKKFENIEIVSAGEKEIIHVWETKMPREIGLGESDVPVPVYFIECDKYFGKSEVYWGNNSERFLFFSLAVVESLKIIDFQPSVIHCHDCHTALIPNILKMNNIRIPTLYTIHNLNYQGRSEIEVLSTGNLTELSLASLSEDARDGDINFMAQGIINADLVNTVSPTYAQEIKSTKQSAGLHRVIMANEKKISGILNGLDTEFFDPRRDRHIEYNYDVDDIEPKYLNKKSLAERLKFISPGLPLIAMISRLAHQKGLELVNEYMIRELDANFVFLGSGEKEYEEKLTRLATEFPGKVSTHLEFNLELAQRIYAASDIFLMPSRFEPCGLGQLIAMRYGSVPVARATGGLRDTVFEKFESKNGFLFRAFKSEALQAALNRALGIYKNNLPKWRAIQLRGMRTDFSWKQSAQKYLEIYNKLLN